MYKKVMFILLTLLFMSGACDLDKTAILLKKAHTASTPIDTTLPGSTTANPIQEPLKTFKTQISLTEINGIFKFKNYYLGIVLFNKSVKYETQVVSIDISTTDAALRAANITKLSEAKNMRDQDKLKELIKSLTYIFRVKAENNINNKEFEVIIDYENLKIIYEGLSNNKTDPALQPRLNSNGRDVEFNKGYTAFKDGGGYFDTQPSKTSIMFDSKSKNPRIIKVLGDILGINGAESFKKYIP